jgi:hypothetical protein
MCSNKYSGGVARGLEPVKQQCQKLAWVEEAKNEEISIKSIVNLSLKLLLAYFMIRIVVG